MMHARAPGKLILTGEHAVLYGAPAAVMAVERHVNVYFTPQPQHSRLQTLLGNLGREGFAYPLRGLRHLKAKLDGHFEEFMQGRRPVQQILRRPDDLLAYTLASVAKRLPPLRGRLHTESALPLGAGMGSSAAVIAATLLIYEGLSGQTASLEQRFQQVRFCERLQHGRGSALDACAVVYGGVHRLRDGQPESLNMDASPWYACLHGIPQSSTGECVAQVRQRHGQDGGLWREFSVVGEALLQALNRPESLGDCIRANQDLLQRIGVVPAAAQDFIRRLSVDGTAVKISGAGSVRGSAAGMLLLHQPDAAAMEALRRRFPQYEFWPLRIAAQGAHRCPEALPSTQT